MSNTGRPDEAIFAAIARRDLALVRQLVAHDPAALGRRRSRFENGHTPLLASFVPPDGLGWLAGKPDYAMLALLIELGADVEAADERGRTPLAVAMLRGDRDAMRLLKAAGARMPHAAAPEAVTASEVDSASEPAKRLSIALFAPDMEATAAWYQAIGFTEAAAYEDNGKLDYVVLWFGAAGIHLNRFGEPLKGASLWIDTDRIDDIYERLKQRQLHAMQAALADEPGDRIEVRFVEDLYAPFYGGRQFGIQDPNGVVLYFHQPD